MELKTNQVLRRIVTPYEMSNIKSSYYMEIPNSLRRYRHLSKNEINVLFELYSWLGMRNEKSVTVSYELIMFYTSIKHPDTLRKTLDSLEEKGYIERERYSNNGRYRFELKLIALNAHALVNETLLEFFTLYYYGKNYKGESAKTFPLYKTWIRKNVIDIIDNYKSYQNLLDIELRIKSMLEEVDETLFWRWLKCESEEEVNKKYLETWREHTKVLENINYVCGELLEELYNILMGKYYEEFEEVD